MSEVMLIDEVAAYLRLGKSTIYRMAREGKIPGVKFGTDWRFDRETIQQLMKRKEETGNGKVGNNDD